MRKKKRKSARTIKHFLSKVATKATLPNLFDLGVRWLCEAKGFGFAVARPYSFEHPRYLEVPGFASYINSNVKVNVTHLFLKDSPHSFFFFLTAETLG